MNQTIRPTIASPQTSAWRLWIDRCGGYSLLIGDRWTVGGARPNGTASVQVRSDWRRFEGTLVRRDGDYFWSHCDRESFESEATANATRPKQEQFIESGGVVPVSGSATMRLNRPSPLSSSALLSLDPPHRFDDHVDHVLLVDQTVLIGPTAGDHIRCTAIDSSAVLVCHDGQWKAKLKSNADSAALFSAKRRTQFIDLVPGRRVSLGELDMMLEAV